LTPGQSLPLTTPSPLPKAGSSLYGWIRRRTKISVNYHRFVVNKHLNGIKKSWLIGQISGFSLVQSSFLAV
jgi:hypothetical protein